MQKVSPKQIKKVRNIYVENYGCSANTHDFEIILGYLSNHDYIIEKIPQRADAIIINTCGVKKPTEDKILNRLRVLRDLEIPIIVAGCLPKINFLAIKSAVPNYAAILDPYSVDNIIQAIDAVKKGCQGTEFFSDKTPIKIELPEKRLNHLIKIVPIAEGCLGECTYCCTRFARGKLSSFPVNRIIEEVKKSVSGGATEIWITGQDTGSYGRDIGVRLTDLLKDLIEISGDFRVRIGMMNPNYAKEMIRDLISIFRDDKVYKFLHIPLQSGSNSVIKSMKRRYSVLDVENIIKKIRQFFPNITIATDIIVGFPTEEEKDFECSVEFVKELVPDVVNLSKFAPRPKTYAAKLNQISSKIINERSKKLSAICSKIGLEINLKYLDSNQIVFINKKIRKNLYEGRLQNYKKILIDNNKDLLGKRVQVKIIRATQRYLEGKIQSKN